MTGVYEINVVRAGVFQFFEYGCQTLHRDGFAFVLVTDGMVLAKATFQRTPREKHGAGPTCTADARLFAIMEGSTSHNGGSGHIAKTVSFVIAALRTALARTY